MRVKEGIVGVSEHAGWAVLVTAAGDGTLLDRRRVDLVERVQASAERHAGFAWKPWRRPFGRA